MGAAVAVIITLWLIFGFIGQAIDKEHPGRGFALGVFLGPVGLIIAAVLHSGEISAGNTPGPAGSTKRCPYCAEEIQALAVVCRYCGRDVPATAPVSQSPAGRPQGWYPHPEYQGQERLWDGEKWTKHSRWAR